MSISIFWGGRSPALPALALVYALILSFCVIMPEQGVIVRQFETIFSAQMRGNIVGTSSARGDDSDRGPARGRVGNPLATGLESRKMSPRRIS